jgi:hypothetical protein
MNSHVKKLPDLIESCASLRVRKKRKSELDFIAFRIHARILCIKDWIYSLIFEKQNHSLALKV